MITTSNPISFPANPVESAVSFKFLISIILLLGFSALRPAFASPDLNQYQLVFGDEFSGSELDRSKWNTGFLWGPYLPINNEEQLYIDTLGMHQNFKFSPFRFTGSSLKIVAVAVTDELQPPARPEENDPIWNGLAEYRYNGPSNDGPGYQPEDVKFLSGVITSYDSFRYTHGYIETRMKLPAGQGLFPAFWTNTSFYVEDLPEIDVMEFLAHDTDRIYHTYHTFEPSNNWNKVSTPSFTTDTENFADGWHTFGMEWGPTDIIWYVNGVETRRVDSSEYVIANQAMYLLANLAVGGNWPGAADASTDFPAELEIDYIRAYQRKSVKKITKANLDSDFQLVFEDTFSGDTIDANKWNSSLLWGPYLTINNERQIYPDSLGVHENYQHNPFSVADGRLTITARHVDENELPSAPKPDSQQFVNNTEWRKETGYRDPENENFHVPDYVSGLLTTYDSFKFVNGYAEISAKLPKGSGLWPAFWLLTGYYVDQQPEIDIMEFRGENTGEIVHSTHFHNQQGIVESDSGTTIGSDYTRQFHTYGVHWQPSKIDWYVDGEISYTSTGEGVSSQTMYLILNLAVGGDFVGAVDNNAFPADYEIDYVRVWQRRLP